MLITDQVATASCTDPVQAHFLTFRAKLFDDRIGSQGTSPMGW